MLQLENAHPFVVQMHDDIRLVWSWHAATFAATLVDESLCTISDFRRRDLDIGDAGFLGVPDAKTQLCPTAAEAKLIADARVCGAAQWHVSVLAISACEPIAELHDSVKLRLPESSVVTSETVNSRLSLSGRADAWSCTSSVKRTQRYVMSCILIC